MPGQESLTETLRVRGGQPVPNGRYVLLGRVVEEHAVIVSSTDQHEVVDLAVFSTGQGCAQFYEHPPPAGLRSHDDDRVGGKHCP